MLMSLLSIEGVGEEVILSAVAFVLALLVFGYYMMRLVNLIIYSSVGQVCDKIFFLCVCVLPLIEMKDENKLFILKRGKI